METTPAADPKSAEDWYRSGNAHQDEGRDDLAVECYERVVQLRPGHAKAWNNLGVSLKEQGRLKEAEDSFRRALHISPN